MEDILAPVSIRMPLNWKVVIFSSLRIDGWVVVDDGISAYKNAEFDKYFYNYHSCASALKANSG